MIDEILATWRAICRVLKHEYGIDEVGYHKTFLCGIFLVWGSKWVVGYQHKSGEINAKLYFADESLPNPFTYAVSIEDPESFPKLVNFMRHRVAL
jgi:hypothetical protein